MLADLAITSLESVQEGELLFYRGQRNNKKNNMHIRKEIQETNSTRITGPGSLVIARRRYRMG